jgi:hypothetical protein
MNRDELIKTYNQLIVEISKEAREEEIANAQKNRDQAYFHLGKKQGLSRFASWISDRIEETDNIN